MVLSDARIPADDSWSVGGSYLIWESEDMMPFRSCRASKVRKRIRFPFLSLPGILFQCNAQWYCGNYSAEDQTVTGPMQDMSLKHCYQADWSFEFKIIFCINDLILDVFSSLLYLKVYRLLEKDMRIKMFCILFIFFTHASHFLILQVDYYKVKINCMCFA